MRATGSASGRPRSLGVLALGVLLAVLTACGGAKAPQAQPGASSAPAPGRSTATVTFAVPSTEPRPRLGMPHAAQCFALAARQLRSTVAAGHPVRCDRPHTTVVAYAGVVRPAVTGQTSAARRAALARRLCLPAFRRAAGGSAASRAMTLLGWTMFNPSVEQLARGARWVRCDVFALEPAGGSDAGHGRLLPLPERLPFLGRGIPEGLRVCQGADGVDVSCARPHVFRVEGVFRVRGSSYPGPAYQREARDRCDSLTGPGGFWQPPSRAGWAAGDRWVRCLSRKG